MESKLPYYLGFSYFLGIGPHRFSLLFKHFGSAQAAYTAPLSTLKELLGEITATKFDTFRKNFSVEKELEMMKQKHITPLSLIDERYPEQLKNIPDPPICLYVKGDVTNYDFAGMKFFGIVGTRKPTSYGLYISRNFSAGLTQNGFTIVSGLAYGVDTAAHLGCLESGGKTIAFLGCGVDIIYPPQNNKLYDQIIASGGLIISEFPPGMTVMKGLFIARNRLISGLSAGIMVVEGLKDSGSLVTAKYALEQGKDVFAPPVPLTSALSEAPNILLKQGAILVTSVEDILEEYGMSTHQVKPTEIPANLSEEEKLIVEKLIAEPLLSDELSQVLQIPVTKILGN